MRYEPISFSQKFSLFNEQWQPKVIAELNDYQFKVVRLQGDFVWHEHQGTDEWKKRVERFCGFDLLYGGQRVTQECTRSDCVCPGLTGVTRAKPGGVGSFAYGRRGRFVGELLQGSSRIGQLIVCDAGKDVRKITEAFLVLLFGRSNASD